MEFGVGACGQLPLGFVSCVVLIARAVVRGWRGRCGVPVGRDVGQDGATPNAECKLEHCAIVLTSVHFEKVMHFRPSIVSSLLCLTFLTTPTPFVAISSLSCRFSAVCGVFVVQRMPGCCCCFDVRPEGYAPLSGLSCCVSRRLNSSSPVACKDVQAQHRRNVPPPLPVCGVLYMQIRPLIN